MLHICVIESGRHCLDNGLSPIRRQAIIWTSADILLIGLLETSFSEMLIKSVNIVCLFVQEDKS